MSQDPRTLRQRLWQRPNLHTVSLDSTGGYEELPPRDPHLESVWPGPTVPPTSDPLLFGLLRYEGTSPPWPLPLDPDPSGGPENTGPDYGVTDSEGLLEWIDLAVLALAAFIPALLVLYLIRRLLGWLFR
jgi:hypothetical protein